MIFYTGHKRAPAQWEGDFGPSMVEVEGYVPAEMQISRLIAAGVKLAEYKRELYEFGIGEEVPEDYIDPTRAPNFDLADASELETMLKEKAAIRKLMKKKAEDETPAPDPEPEEPPVEGS